MPPSFGRLQGFVQRLQKRFPNPTRIQNNTNESRRPLSERGSCYCVGGAVVMGVGWHTLANDEFPEALDLMDCLVERFGVPRPQAYRGARSILRQNDEGRFHDAWRTLARTLQYATRLPRLVQE